MAHPSEGFTYFIINKEIPVAWDISHEDNTYVVGLPLNRQESQKWKFTSGTNGDWLIQNMSNGKFVNLEKVDPIEPGVRLITADQRNWTVQILPDYHAVRILVPNTKLDAMPVVGPPPPGIPIMLGGEEPSELLQLWIFQAVMPQD